MRQAISTKYLGPTNTRGSKVKATAEAGSITLHWDDALDIGENHVAAARALAQKYKWAGIWHGGATADGYVFVTQESPDLRPALRNLVDYAAGNRGSRTGNPYMVPEMKDAIRALGGEDNELPDEISAGTFETWRDGI